MLTSSAANCVTFKNLDGSYPNRWNTLHANRKQGGFTIIPYCQKFNKDDTVIVQFTSDNNTVPTFKTYGPALIDTIVGTLESSYEGDANRYFFNFEIPLGANYYDKKITFIVTQGTDTLTSEPIECRDLTDDLTSGKLKYVKYTNLDRVESDLSDYWIDWSVIDFMYFYVEAIDKELGDPEEVEVFEGAQYKEKVAAANFAGVILKTGGIPDYMSLRLKIVSNYDYFAINGIEYIREGDVDTPQYGGSTSVQVSLELTEKVARGVNVDDLGIVLTDNDMAAIVPKRNNSVNTAGWEVPNPSGYMLHSIFIKHAISSSGDAVVKVGTSVAGDDLIDEVAGSIPKSGFTTIWKRYSIHHLKDPDNASTVYISVSGAGTVLQIIVNFDTVTEES